MLSRAGDGEHVEQLEIVEPEHIHEAGGPPVSLSQIKPPVKLTLGLTDRGFDAGDAMTGKSHIVPFRHEGDLILQVSKPVVDRRRRQHQHLGLHPGLDDPLHQMVVAGIPILMGRLVPEVMRLVDDDEIVIAPIDV